MARCPTQKCCLPRGRWFFRTYRFCRAGAGGFTATGPASVGPFSLCPIGFAAFHCWLFGSQFKINLCPIEPLGRCPTLICRLPLQTLNSRTCQFCGLERGARTLSRRRTRPQPYRTPFWPCLIGLKLGLPSRRRRPKWIGAFEDRYGSCRSESELARSTEAKQEWHQMERPHRRPLMGPGP